MTSPDQGTRSELDDVRPRYRRSLGGGVRLLRRGARSLRRAWRRILIAVLALAAAVLLWWLPEWMLASARERADDCSRRIEQSGDGTASACRQDGRLWLPKLAPWTRSEAIRAAAAIERQEAAHALDLAVRRDVDAAAGTRAALALVRAQQSEPLRGTFYDVGHRLRTAGAETVLVARAAELETAIERALALDAAVRTGDRSSMRRIAALPAGQGPSARFDRQRGAALCALGDRDAGMAALDRAVAVGDGELEPSLAMALCDPDRPAKTIPELSSVRLRHARAIGGRAQPPGRSQAYRDGPAIAAMQLLARADGVKARDLLPFIASSAERLLQPGHNMKSPWSILGSSTGLPAAPAWSDASAARLIGMADAIRAGKPGIFDREDALEYRIGLAAADDPAGALRWGAMVLALDAAVGWTRRGDLSRARASAGTAVVCAQHADLARMDPPPPLFVIPLLHLVGQRDAALAALDTLAARVPPDDPELGAELALQRALLLASAGRVAEAWTALDPVMKAEVEGHTRDRIRWVRAALALRLRRPLDVSLPRAPVESSFAHAPALTLAYWWSAATDARVRRIRRWRASSMGQGFDGFISVLPAVLYVVGHAAGDGQVEVWLDAIAASESVDPQAMMSARAEAARWRGDDGAVKRWEQQLAAHRALATDDRTAALIDLARW